MADTAVNLENKTAEELLGEGIRAYIVTYYDQAIAMLSKACELLEAEHKSPLHPSLGEAYLYYGKSLLEQARVEAEALGDGVPKNAEDESDEEDLEPEEGEGSAEKKPEQSEDDKASNDMEVDSNEREGNEENGQSSMEEQPEDKPGPSKAVTEGDANEPENEEDADGDTNDDLQLAWEVLELAKKIFLGQGDDGRKNLAETLIALAEVSLENGNFEAAIADMNEGLRVQRLIFGKDSRTIAETCFKLGVAYSMSMKIDEAIRSFNDSLQCLKIRIGKLEMSQKTDEVTDEIKEMRLFIPDIVEKIAEMKSYKDEMLQKLISTAVSGSPLEAPSPSASSSSSSQPANNITHLVKRKRKLDTIAEETPENCAVKRPNNGDN